MPASFLHQGKLGNGTPPRDSGRHAEAE
jgi:hypothetical protein